MESYIKVYDNVLEPAICEVIKKKFDDAGSMFKRKGGVATQESVYEYHPEMKVSTDLCIGTTPNWQEVDDLLFRNLQNILDRYFTEFPSIREDVSYDSDEGYRIRKYDKGEGHFNYHTDASSMKVINRRLVIIWYLNDVEEGGETHFIYQDIYVKPKRGRVLIFPPFWMYKHAGLTPISDDKYIIRTFLTKNK